MALAALVVAIALLAWANGANDNFKGVATLYGSGALTYRRALAVATAATLLGSAVSVALAHGLVQGFSGRGLLPDALLRSPTTLLGVAGAAAATVLLATRLGLPTSTTHALTGALLGVALAHGRDGALGVAWQGFLLPLLVSPPLAMLGAMGLHAAGRALRLRAGLQPESCVCVEPAPVVDQASPTSGLLPLAAVGTRVRASAAGDCPPAATSPRLDARTALDGLHVVSGATVCFARAVNDTPKIAALGFVLADGAWWLLGGVAAAMSLGGLLGARRVAETVGRRITPMNAGQGAAGNLMTAGLVLGASHLGLPVSTTHVSCGAIMGLGVAGRTADRRVMGAILLAWAATLPLAALLGATLSALLRDGGS